MDVCAERYGTSYMEPFLHQWDAKFYNKGQKKEEEKEEKRKREVVRRISYRVARCGKILPSSHLISHIKLPPYPRALQSQLAKVASLPTASNRHAPVGTEHCTVSAEYTLPPFVEYGKEEEEESHQVS